MKQIFIFKDTDEGKLQNQVNKSLEELEEKSYSVHHVGCRVLESNDVITYCCFVIYEET